MVIWFLLVAIPNPTVNASILKKSLWWGDTDPSAKDTQDSGDYGELHPSQCLWKCPVVNQNWYSHLALSLPCNQTNWQASRSQFWPSVVIWPLSAIPNLTVNASILQKPCAKVPLTPHLKTPKPKVAMGHHPTYCVAKSTTQTWIPKTQLPQG